MRSRLNGWLEARSSPYLIALSLALVTIVLSVDLLTGDELTLSIFYLAPTALADWFAGRRAGLVISFLAGAAWYVAAAIEFHGYSNAFVSPSNAAVRIAFLLVIAHLLTTLRAIGRRRTSWRRRVRAAPSRNGRSGGHDSGCARSRASCRGSRDHRFAHVQHGYRDIRYGPRYRRGDDRSCRRPDVPSEA